MSALASTYHQSFRYSYTLASLYLNLRHAHRSMPFLSCPQSFDRDHDGKLSLREFSAALERLGYRVSSHEAAELAALFDDNKDGAVSYAEFANFCLPDSDMNDADASIWTTKRIGE